MATEEQESKLYSVIRHLLSGAGGALLSVGVSQAAVVGLTNAAVPVIGGLVTWGISQAWSLLAKKVKF